MREPYQGRTDVRLEPEVSRGGEQINLSSSHNPPQQHLSGPQQSRPKGKAIPQPNLNPYQARLLEELKSRPKVMDLLGVIFSQYPAIIVREARQSSPNATNRQRGEGRRSAIIRLQIESFIEEEIAKLGGIDVAALQIATQEKTVEPKEETPTKGE